MTSIKSSTSKTTIATRSKEEVESHLNQNGCSLQELQKLFEEINTQYHKDQQDFIHAQNQKLESLPINSEAIQSKHTQQYTYLNTVRHFLKSALDPRKS